MSDFNEIKTPDMNEPWDGEGLPSGAKAGLWVILGVLIGAAIPYFVAPLLEVCTDPQRRARLVASLRSMSDDVVAYKNLQRLRERVLAAWD